MIPKSMLSDAALGRASIEMGIKSCCCITSGALESVPCEALDGGASGVSRELDDVASRIVKMTTNGLCDW